MLSKSKGQILRVAAVLHVLFHLEQPDKIPPEISVAALKAADNFVSVCLQHAAYIAGRGLVEEAIKQAEARKCCNRIIYIVVYMFRGCHVYNNVCCEHANGLAMLNLLNTFMYNPHTCRSV